MTYFLVFIPVKIKPCELKAAALMLKAAQLVERLPLSCNYLTLFYCFGEKFEFTSRFSSCQISENTTESEWQVSCDLLVSRANIYAVLTKAEKQLLLSINKTLSRCYRIEHGIASVYIKFRLDCSPKLYKGIFRSVSRKKRKL